MGYKYVFNPLSGAFDTVQDVAGLVPYTGATTNVNLGTRSLTAGRGYFTGESFTVGNVTACTATILYNGLGNYYNSGYSTTARVFAYKDTAFGRVYSPSYFQTTTVTDNGAEDTNYQIRFAITPVTGADGYHVQLQSDYDGSTFPDDFVTTTTATYDYDGDVYESGTLPTPSIRYGLAVDVLGTVTATNLDVESTAEVGGALTVTGATTLTGAITGASSLDLAGNINAPNITLSGNATAATGNFGTSLACGTFTATTGTINTLNSTTGTITTGTVSTLTSTTGTIGTHTYNSTGVSFASTGLITAATGIDLTIRGSAATNSATNGGTPGSNGQFIVTANTGGNVTGAGALANTAGAGGSASVRSGAGGAASGSTTTNTGGNGGAFFLTGGNGGLATGATATTNLSGTGGSFFLSGGAGGASTQVGSVNNTGGTGGGLVATSGAGGNASGGTTTNTAGRGGDVSFTGGAAGTATGTGATGNAGGTVSLTGGAASGNSNGGSISLIGGAKAGSGTDGNVLINVTTGGTQKGKTGINTASNINAQLTVESATQQCQLRYSTGNECNITVGATGGVTFDAVGSGAGFTFSDSVNITSSLQCDSIVNDTGLAHGTYTPTLTNTTNVDSSTARLATYLRVGNSVTVSGQLDIDPTITATATLLGISLPIASNFSTAFQAGGTAFATGVAGMGGGIEADATNDRVSLKFISSDITNQTMAYTFSYQII